MLNECQHMRCRFISCQENERKMVSLNCISTFHALTRMCAPILRCKFFLQELNYPSPSSRPQQADSSYSPSVCIATKELQHLQHGNTFHRTVGVHSTSPNRIVRRAAPLKQFIKQKEGTTQEIQLNRTPNL